MSPNDQGIRGTALESTRVKLRNYYLLWLLSQAPPGFSFLCRLFDLFVSLMRAGPKRYVTNIVVASGRFTTERREFSFCNYSSNSGKVAFTVTFFLIVELVCVSSVSYLSSLLLLMFLVDRVGQRSTCHRLRTRRTAVTTAAVLVALRVKGTSRSPWWPSGHYTSFVLAPSFN